MADALIEIRMRGGGTDFSNGSSYPGCACSLQKAATAMLKVHRNLPRPSHSTSEVRVRVGRSENGREAHEIAASPTLQAKNYR